MKTIKHRDLTLTSIPGGTLVVACDSCAGAGEKAHDVLRVAPYYAGRFCARVPLMEVLAFGARVAAVNDALCCEMEPTGREILRGVGDELAAAGVEAAVLSGSTEENFPTTTTGLGVTVVGYVEGEARWTAGRPGDFVYCIGLPKMGAQVVLEGDPEIVCYQDIRALRDRAAVGELIPVGSKGIRWEAENAASCYGLHFVPREDCPPAVDLEASAGPATCLLAVTGEPLEEQGRVRLVGRLEGKRGEE